LNEIQIIEVLTSATDIVLEHAEVLAYWVDRNGLLPGGGQGATYALGRLKKELHIRN
jgi:hypothetical protein